MQFKDQIKKLQEFYVNYDLDWVEDFVKDLESEVSDEKIVKKYRVITETRRDESHEIVLDCSYDFTDKNYYVVLNLRLLENDEMVARYHKQLVAELKRAFVHEDTHRQQDQTSFEHLKNDPNEKQYKDYLSHHTEIAARAREFAQYLKDTGSSVFTSAMARIATHDNISPYSKILIKYQKIGGEIYKKFLNELFWAYDSRIDRRNYK